jgi:hypothetical protein
MQADLAVDQIHVLVVLELQIDRAVLAEALDRIAGLRIEREQPVARRDIEDAFLSAVAPVRQPASGELARRRVTTRPLEFLVHPEQLARCRIERDDRAARPGRRVDDATSHQRRRFELELRSRTEVLGLESPCNLELVEVTRVDLVKRRVARVGEISAVGRPFAVSRPDLAGDGQRRPDQQTDKRDETEIPPTNRVSHDSSVSGRAELIHQKPPSRAVSSRVSQRR